VSFCLCADLLGRELLVDLVSEFFREKNLRRAAVPAVYEGAFVFTMQDGLAARAEARIHYCEG
jgi:hypothetical protein